MSIQLNGYSICEELYTGKNSEIYRGFRSSDMAPVVIKHLSKEFPSTAELSRRQHAHSTQRIRYR